MQTVADFRTYTLISDLANAHDTSARRPTRELQPGPQFLLCLIHEAHWR